MTNCYICGRVDLNNQNTNTTLRMEKTLETSIKADEPESTAKTVKMMEKLHAEEIFTTPEKSKEFLDSLNFEDFQKWLNLVNGLERGIKSPGREMDGAGYIEIRNDFVGIAAPDYIPPHPSSRAKLMEEALESAKSTADPETAGLMLGLVINAVHPYNDGNGRTARMVYSLLSHGYDGSNKDGRYYSSLLENTVGREVIDPNPHNHNLDSWIAEVLRKDTMTEAGYDGTMPTHVYGGYGEVCVEDQTPDELMVDPSTSEENKNKLHNVLMDRKFAAGTFFRALPKEMVEQYIKKVEFKGGSTCFIRGDELVSKLTEEQIDKLYAEAQNQKYEYVRALISLPKTSSMPKIVELYRNDLKG